MADKVKFGIKNVHYAVLSDETTPTYETPVAIPGAVSFSLEANGDTSPFYADNMQYFVIIRPYTVFQKASKPKKAA